MISASDISMRFGQQTLFENVSVKFNPGCRYGLIGANGSGKSTFMKILTGQQQPTTGSIAVDKECRIGFLKQNHYDYEEVPILDVVCMGNEKLWSIHREREYLYSKADLTPEEEERANDIDLMFTYCSGCLIRKAHKLGHEVNLWTVNKLSFAKYFMRLGVDYITTKFDFSGKL